MSTDAHTIDLPFYTNRVCAFCLWKTRKIFIFARLIFMIYKNQLAPGIRDVGDINRLLSSHGTDEY